MYQQDNFEGILPRSKSENYTQVPNKVFDYVMKKVSGSQFKIYCAIIRNTYGWIDGADKNGNAVYKIKDKISISDFKEITGLSKPTIINNLKDLIEQGFVEKLVPGKTNHTKATYKVKQRQNKLSTTGKNSLPELVKEFNQNWLKNFTSSPAPTSSVSREDSTPKEIFKEILKEIEEEDACVREKNGNKGEKKKEDDLHHLQEKAGEVVKDWKKYFPEESLSPHNANKIKTYIEDGIKPSSIKEVMKYACRHSKKNPINYFFSILNDLVKNNCKKLAQVQKFLNGSPKKLKESNNKSNKDANKNKQSLEELYESGYR